LLLDYWPLERFERNNIRSLILEKVPFITLSATSSVITFLVQRSGGAVAPIVSLPLSTRIANCFISYIKYIQKTIWPSGLAVFHPHPMDTIVLRQTILAASLLLAISFAAIILASRHKYLFTGWFWYLGTLVPVIGLVQVGDQAWAGRYSYIPLIGLFIIAAWWLPSLLKNAPTVKVVSVAAFIIVSAWAVSTFFQLHYWRTSKTLFEHALEVTEDNYVAHYCLGNWLFQQGETDESINHFYESLQINPDYMLAHISLGVALAKQGQLDRSIEQFQFVMKSHPDFPGLYYNLGFALASQGKYEDAVKQYKKAVELNPDYIKAYNNLGIAYSFLGKFDDAVESYQKALQLKPDYAEAHNNLGTLLSSQGKLDEAIGHFTKSLQFRPNAVNTLTNLGYALARNGKIDEGIGYLSQAVELNPNLAEAHYYLALVLAQNSRFDEAVQHAERALMLAQSTGNRQLAQRIQENLDSYKIGQK